MHRDVNELYLNWLMHKIGPSSVIRNYSNLFMKLHSIEYTYSYEMDGNRASDGIALRILFCREKCMDEDEVLYSITGPCTVFEMMVALSKKCEEIMHESKYGDRTGYWFFQMLTSLGLEELDNRNYDEYLVEAIMDNFLKVKYSKNGAGGLYYIPDTDKDLRKLELWKQMQLFIKNLD